MTRKRKAEDVVMEDSDDQMAKLAVALRDEHKKARINSELSKHGLFLGFSPAATEVKIKQENLEDFEFI